MSERFLTILSELKETRDDLLDEASKIETIPTIPALSKLAQKLSEIIPLNHLGAKEERPDILHGRWAEAIMATFYCGCISQQKAAKPEYGDYNQISDLIRKTLVAAFEEGIKYAPERENKTHR